MTSVRLKHYKIVSLLVLVYAVHLSVLLYCGVRQVTRLDCRNRRQLPRGLNSIECHYVTKTRLQYEHRVGAEWERCQTDGLRAKHHK